MDKENRRLQEKRDKENVDKENRRLQQEKEIRRLQENKEKEKRRQQENKERENKELEERETRERQARELILKEEQENLERQERAKKLIEESERKEKKREERKKKEREKKKEVETEIPANIQIEFQEFDPEDSLKRKSFAAEKKHRERTFQKEESRPAKVDKAKQSSFFEKFNISKSEGNINRSFSDTFSVKQIDFGAPKNKDRIVNIKKKFESSNELSCAEVKDAKDLDRSVDVYHETIRQRSIKDKQAITPDLFESNKPSKNSMSNSVPKQYLQTNTDSMKPKNSTLKVSRKIDKEAGEPGLPSVRKLLARFEPGHFNSVSDAVNKHSRFSREERIIKRGMSMDSIVSIEEGKAEEVVSTKLPPAESKPVVQTKQVDEAESPPTGSWDPKIFIKSLYNLPAVEELNLKDEDGPVSLDCSSACPSIEGYMEKLPAGRKRPTLWNSWKKHYFVARNGTLHIYTNKSQTELLEKLELFGGQVDFMDSNMLGVEDRRGQYVVVRCASHKAAQEWESALSFHTLENYAKTFVSPLPIPREIKTMSNIIVVDLGGASIRAGISGPTPYLPRLFFPSLMAVNPDNHHEKYFGFDALKPEIRTKFKVYSPLLPSKNIDKYSVDLVALCGLLLKVFQELRVDPKKSELQLSVPRIFNDKTKIAIAALLFDEFEVRSVNMGHQSVFTLHSYSTDTGIVVDIGERMDIVPIVSGYKVQSGLSRAATGGMELCGHMRHALLGRNYSLTTFLDTYVVRQVVERLCYLARNFDTEYETYAGEEKTVNLSEGSRIPAVTLGTERFQITEGIFKPEMWGLDQAGVHVLVKKAISECSLDVRKEVSQSIYLSGGLTLIPGFKHRLETELAKILPTRPRVHASPYRYHAAFLGACAHATSPAYDLTKITRNQWNQGNTDVATAWVL